jgi:hypothetical protein
MSKRAGGVGAIVALATLAAWYAGADLMRQPPPPDVVQPAILAILPGAAFGFLIDNLQHFGKVAEEAGLLLAVAATGALAGAGAARLWRLRTRPASPWTPPTKAGGGCWVPYLSASPVSGSATWGGGCCQLGGRHHPAGVRRRNRPCRHARLQLLPGDQELPGSDHRWSRLVSADRGTGQRAPTG